VRSTQSKNQEYKSSMLESFIFGTKDHFCTKFTINLTNGESSINLQAAILSVILRRSASLRRKEKYLKFWGA
jgi:hypothetical protein